MDFDLAAPGPVGRAVFDRPVAVIGDVHGRSDLLDRLLAALGEDVPVVVAGDLGDRGPDTAGVIERLVARGAVGVRGNHDEWLVRWANGRGFDTAALAPFMGGAVALASYGVQGRTPTEIEAESWRVPRAHAAWLDALPLALALEVQGQRYWVVHAGVPASVSLRGVAVDDVVPHLARTAPSLLLWSYNPPEDALPVDRTVVMGHMVVPEPVDLGHVIAVDTGSGFPDGRLTAVILPERRFVTVGP
jgi:serine/threonine protein phosphatase 1